MGEVNGEGGGTLKSLSRISVCVCVVSMVSVSTENMCTPQFEGAERKQAGRCWHSPALLRVVAHRV